MQIKILFDKRTIDKKYSIGWGFSCLLDEKILFDTGEQASYLLNNIDLMGIERRKIESVVISHDHWDHTGGLWEMLSNNPGLRVFSCPNFSIAFKDKVAKHKGKLIECNRLTQITDSIYSTGEIIGEYKGEKIAEQAIIVKTDNGISVISGCAHPDIITILKNVHSNFPDEKLYMVFGGFHLMEKDARSIQLSVEGFKELGVIKAGPTHCSGVEAEKLFHQAYGENFINIKVGQTIEV